jgi:hypothetical protein
MLVASSEKARDSVPFAEFAQGRRDDTRCWVTAVLLRAVHGWVHCYFAFFYYLQLAGPILFAVGA